MQSFDKVFFGRKFVDEKLLSCPGRPFPLVDFISRWRHGNGNGNGTNTGNSKAGNDEMYLDETPSSPLLPYRKRKSSPADDVTSGHEVDDFVPYPAPAAFLESTDSAQNRLSVENNCDDSVTVIRRAVVDDDGEDDDYDDDDLQSIKSYDGLRISSYDNRSLRLQEVHDQAENEGQADREPSHLLSNFFSDAGNFFSDQRAKLQGDKSRTRLKESDTEMKLLRWEFDFWRIIETVFLLQR